MPLDVTGYHSAFQSFVDFALKMNKSGLGTAIASATVTRPLQGRKVLTVEASEGDSVHKFRRTGDEYYVNDNTRSIFKKAVASMFGGESKIPASVKKAMLLDDYNAGRPLTARRILAVKAAIDADGTARARAERIRLVTFDDPANKAALLAKGYSKAELPRLARAAHFYVEAFHCAEFEALDALTTPGSKANRLLRYGGRFLESAANFREGMRLLDSFADWFAETKATVEATDRNYQAGMSKTVLNGKSIYFHDNVLRGMEKFVFEELACNPAHDLAEQDAEKLFGMENNGATRFFGRGFGNAFTQTVANIPPARRTAFYAALDTVFPLITDPAVANLPVFRRAERGFETVSDVDHGEIIARAMKNLDKLQTLFDKGQLTLRNFVKTCFPEARHNTIAGVNALIEKWGLEMRGDEVNDIEPKYPPNLAGPMQMTMEETGCTIEEAFEAANGGKQPPVPKYVASGTLPLSAYDGTVREARNQFEGDIKRPSNYSIKDGPANLLANDAGFRFAFPDGTYFRTNATAEGRARIPAVADKVEALCGAVHLEQASSVLMMLSQAGLGALRGGLAAYGIASDEHAAVEYTLSKDSATGTVTIKYSSLEELPFRFEWTASVDVFGNVTSTPMKFERPVGNLDVPAAKKTLSAAAKKLGVTLDKASLDAGAALLSQHGAGMYAKNLAYLASYVARSPLTGRKAAAAAARIADLAARIRGWRDFSFEDAHKTKELAQAVARRHNEYIEECFADETKYHLEKGERTAVFETFFQDAPRNTYVINGKVFKKDTVANAARRQKEVMAALKSAVPGEKAQKALTVLMNQSGPGDILQFTNHLPVPGRNGMEPLHELPGADLFANRDMTTGLYPTQIFGPSMSFGLDMAKDGRSAVVTLTLDARLEAGDGVRVPGRDTTFGTVQIQERITVDLTPETPVVTDVAFAQRLA